MRRALARTVLVCSAAGLAACDPAYSLGARARLAPAPAAACVGAALRASPRRTEVRPLESREGTSFRLALHDTAAGDRRDTGWRTATLSLTAGPDSVGVLSLTYWWIGTARTVPLAEQRRLVALAADVLSELRAACAPNAAPPHVECVARGLGGAPACRPAAVDEGMDPRTAFHVEER